MFTCQGEWGNVVVKASDSNQLLLGWSPDSATSQFCNLGQDSYPLSLSFLFDKLRIITMNTLWSCCDASLRKTSYNA